MRLRIFTFTLLLASLLLLAVQPGPSSSQTTSNRAAARSAATPRPSSSQSTSNKAASSVARPPQQQDSCVEYRRQLQSCHGDNDRLNGVLSGVRQQLLEAQSRAGGGDVPPCNVRELEGRIRSLTAENSSLRESLASCRNQPPCPDTCRNRLDELNGQLSRMRASNDSLSGQLAALRSERDRLAREGGDLRSRNEELTLNVAHLNSTISDLNHAGDQMSAQLRDEQANSARLAQQLSALGVQQSTSNSKQDTLEQQLERANANLTATTAQLRDAQQQNRDLSLQLASASRPSAQSPAALLASAKVAEGAGGGEGGEAAKPFKLECGKTYIVRDLVFGRLVVSYDDGAIKPGNTFLLKAVFTPRDIPNSGSLKDAQENKVDWFLELRYDPPAGKLKADYDRDQSGRKDARRLVNLNSEETWAWTVTLPKDFERENSDLIVYAEYKMDSGSGGPADVLREQIKLAVPPGPGVVAAVKENFTYILGILSTLLGLRLGWLELRQRKSKEKKATPPADTQPETQPS